MDNDVEFVRVKMTLVASLVLSSRGLACCGMMLGAHRVF